MSTAVWYRQDAAWMLSGAVRETGELAIFWPVILSLMKLRGGSLSDGGLSDFAIRSSVGLPSKPRPVTTEIRDAFADVGLLVREGDEWVTPNWERYQPDGRPNSRGRAPSQGVPGTSGMSQGHRGQSGPTGSPRASQNSPLHDVTVLDQTQRNDHPESNAVEVAPPSPAPPRARPSAKGSTREADPRVLEVHAHWLAALGKTGAAAKTDTAAGKTRLKLIAARLADGYDVAQLKAAIDGCARSDFHREGGHTDLTLIMRADKVDGFEGRATAPAPRSGGFQPYLEPGDGARMNERGWDE